jgi:rod shape-determining protein MreD
MKNLLAFPLLALVLIFQSSVISRLSLLAGTADLMLLVLAGWALQEQVDSSYHWAVLGGIMTSFVSGLPFYVPVIGYLIVAALARLVLRRVWETPILAMFIVTFTGTLIFHIISLIALSLTGSDLPVQDAFSLITLPSVLLNMLLALPVSVMVRDLADWLYPVKEGV